MRQVILSFLRHRLMTRWSRLFLIGLTALIVSTLTTWNNPKTSLQAKGLNSPLTTKKPLKTIKEPEQTETLAMVMTNCTHALKSCSNQKIIYQSQPLQDLSEESLSAHLINYPYQIIRSSSSTEIKGRVYFLPSAPIQASGKNYWTTAFFFTGGFTTWLTVETILSRHQKRKQDQDEQVQFKQQQSVFSHRIQRLREEREQLHTKLTQSQAIQANLQRKIKAKTAEIESLQQEAKELESYILSENQLLESEKEQLLTEKERLHCQLHSAKQQIRHLQRVLKQKKAAKVRLSQPVLSQDSEPQFLVLLSDNAQTQLYDLAQTQPRRYKKVIKTFKTMSQNLRHPSLQTHEYDQFSGAKGEKVFESYVEQGRAGAWRVFWYYGPGAGCLTIDQILPHP